MNLKFSGWIVLKIILFSSIIGLCYNYLSIRGIAIIRHAPPTFYESDSTIRNLIGHNDSIIVKIDSPEIVNRPIQNIKKEIKRPKALSLNQAYNLYISGKAVFIDARDNWDFSGERIKGAINLPEYKFEEEKYILKSISKKTPIICYCDAEDCGSSKNLSVKISDIGYSNVYYFVGGIYEWRKSGYPTEEGEE